MVNISLDLSSSQDYYNRQRAEQRLPGAGVGGGIAGKQVQAIFLGDDNVLQLIWGMAAQLCQLNTNELHP